MIQVKTGELKAKLSKYLRMVQAGDEVQVLDRQNPIARILQIDKDSRPSFRAPLKDPSGLKKLVSKVKSTPSIDIVQLLIEDRRK